MEGGRQTGREKERASRGGDLTKEREETGRVRGSEERER